MGVHINHLLGSVPSTLNPLYSISISKDGAPVKTSVGSPFFEPYVHVVSGVARVGHVGRLKHPGRAPDRPQVKRPTHGGGHGGGSGCG